MQRLLSLISLSRPAALAMLRRDRLRGNERFRKVPDDVEFRFVSAPKPCTRRDQSGNEEAAPPAHAHLRASAHRLPHLRRTVLAVRLTHRNPSPDGDTYGSRWSRAKRETTGNAIVGKSRPRQGSRTMLAMPSTHTSLHIHGVQHERTRPVDRRRVAIRSSRIHRRLFETPGRVSAYSRRNIESSRKSTALISMSGICGDASIANAARAPYATPAGVVILSTFPFPVVARFAATTGYRTRRLRRLRAASRRAGRSTQT